MNPFVIVDPFVCSPRMVQRSFRTKELADAYLERAMKREPDGWGGCFVTTSEDAVENYNYHPRRMA